MIATLFKLLGVILVLGALGLVGYAYFGDLSPQMRDVSVPVVLDVD